MGLRAVSYTHLDVYKRQVRYNVTALQIAFAAAAPAALVGLCCVHAKVRFINAGEPIIYNFWYFCLDRFTLHKYVILLSKKATIRKEYQKILFM